MRLPRIRRPAFTLVELLVVIAIIGVLVALLLPAVQAARESGRRTSCQNNIRQFGVACTNYHDTFNVLPTGAMPAYTAVNRSNELGWQVLILPFIEQKGLHSEFNFNAAGYTDAQNLNQSLFLVNTYICPSAVRLIYQTQYAAVESVNGKPAYTTHYYGVMGPKGINPATGLPYMYTVAGTTTTTMGNYARQGVLKVGEDCALQDVIDGTSNTFLVGELSWMDANVYRAWTRGTGGSLQVSSCKNVVYPINSQPYTANNFNDVSFGSQHPGGCHFVMCDGSVKFVTETVDMVVYRASASMNGKETESVR